MENSSKVQAKRCWRSGRRELVGDAEFAAEEGEIVVEGLVGAVGSGVELGAEVGGEEVGEEFEEPITWEWWWRGGGVVVDEGEVVGVGEHGEEVAGGFVKLCFLEVVGFGVVDFGGGFGGWYGRGGGCRRA